ncbi:MAG: RsmD family RNA methyltransferase [Rubripirellula sp.]
MKAKRKKHTGASAGKAPKPVKLRIIGGDMRGRTILYHGADFTRPMKDNIRENLFNILGRAVRGAICFDMFAGTAALAFESISRGAKSAVAVEQNRQAVRCIKQTAESLDITARMKVISGDSFRLTDQLLAAPNDDTPWIVYLCPPYVLWEDALDGLNGMIRATLEHAPPGSVLVVETEKSFDRERLPAGEWDWREYGNTRLGFIEPATQCGLRM